MMKVDSRSGNGWGSHSNLWMSSWSILISVLEHMLGIFDNHSWWINLSFRPSIATIEFRNLIGLRWHLGPEILLNLVIWVIHSSHQLLTIRVIVEAAITMPKWWPILILNRITLFNIWSMRRSPISILNLWYSLLSRSDFTVWSSLTSHIILILKIRVGYKLFEIIRVLHMRMLWVLFVYVCLLVII